MSAGERKVFDSRLCTRLQSVNAQALTGIRSGQDKGPVPIHLNHPNFVNESFVLIRKVQLVKDHKDVHFLNHSIIHAQLLQHAYESLHGSLKTSMDSSNNAAVL